MIPFLHTTLYETMKGTDKVSTDQMASPYSAIAVGKLQEPGESGEAAGRRPALYVGIHLCKSLPFSGRIN